MQMGPRAKHKDRRLPGKLLLFPIPGCPLRQPAGLQIYAYIKLKAQ